MTDEIWLNLPLLGGYQRVTRESNPVAWAYAHGSDLSGNLDHASSEALDEAYGRIETRKNDWHFDVPETHWRTRDGRVIVISEMEDDHLGHCIRFARTRKRHASRLRSLLAEKNKRDV